MTATVYDPTTATGRTRRRQLLAGCLGNCVEWYDWTLFTILGVYFSRQVFPHAADNSFVPLLQTFAVFAVGYFFRPLGGLLLGALADRRGRREAMAVTLSLMGLGCLILAAVPTYRSAGLLSPAVMVAARVVQGLAAGGESSTAIAYLSESAPRKRRGFYAGLMHSGEGIGLLVATGAAALTSQVLPPAAMSTYGWRIPFALGAVAALVGVWIRYRSQETSDVAEAVRAGRAERPGVLEFLTRHPRQTLVLAGVVLAGTASQYLWLTFLPTYAHLTTGISRSTALTTSTIALVFFVVVQPLSGLAADRIGHRRMLIAFGIAATALTAPLLFLLRPSAGALLAVQCGGALLCSLWSTSSLAVMSDLLPVRCRVTGIGATYGATAALVGGTLPLVGTALSGHGDMPLFGGYLTALALITTAVCVFALPKALRTAHTDRTDPYDTPTPVPLPAEADPAFASHVVPALEESP